jgi:hypothetical protein
MRYMATVVALAALAIPSAALSYPDEGSGSPTASSGLEAKSTVEGYVQAMPDDYDALAKSNESDPSDSSVVLVSNNLVPEGLQAKTIIEQYGAAEEATGETISGR